MNPAIRVRRPLITHIFHLAWTALTLYRTLDSRPPARFIWGILFVIAIALIVRVVLKPYYIELTGTCLTLHNDFFSTQTIDIADIERIEIQANPWSKSRIILKDNKGNVKFDYHQVRGKDFNALLKYLDVPVG